MSIDIGKMGIPEYVPHKDRDARIKSATTAIKVLVGLEILEFHKKELISVCLWKISEADGKYKTRFQSKAALNAKKEQLRHDHVFERKSLIENIIDKPEEIDKILTNAIGCIVTKEEHSELTNVSREKPQLEGWQRYIEAGIKVFDLKEQKEVKLKNV